MRKLAWVVCAALSMSFPLLAQQTGGTAPSGEDAAPPLHPVTVEQVHEMLRLTGYESIKKQIVQNMMPYIRQSMPFMPPDVLDDFQARMQAADFDSIIVKSYQAHLSTEDAVGIIAFYKTPAGQHMISQMPMILKETQQAGADLGQKTMSAVVEAHRSEIEDAAKKYQQDHSGAAPQP
jgi:uncharacterized protein